ncbi:MAG: hypothetical protein Q4D27_04775 [Coriobacteriia bacterium]|nr:hypothetical protein [Coriobacteriia bacterium]
MAAASGTGFKLIDVHEDDDELVVHAGSGVSASAAEPAGDTADAAPAAAVAPAAEAPAAQPEAASPRNARQEELLRRAEELERAEAGLSDPKAFSGMHRTVLIVLAAIVIAFVVYIAFLRG